MPGANEPVKQFRKVGLTDSFDWSFRIKLYNNGNRESVKEQRRGVIICSLLYTSDADDERASV